jgi:hypothetical protein
MASRRLLAFVLAAALSSMGAAYRTTNFVVEAPTPQIAQQIGVAAEQYRKLKASEWLGREMGNWREPCPLKVEVKMSGAGGATSFAFDPQGRAGVLGQKMHIEGSLDRLLASVLPHEVTHTVFAYYFGTPVPRWADEGGAVLSEDDIERNRHDQLVRQILNAGRAMPLRRLFGLKEYPNDVMTLYAEGYSVTQYLVDRSNRQTFLAFIAAGMSQGWDNASRTYYRYSSVEELEQAWLAHLRATKRQPGALLARGVAPADEAGQAVRLIRTIPPTQPAPVYRGQGQDPDPVRDARPTSRQGYLPGYPPNAPPPPPAPGGWQPAGPMTPPPPQPAVRLGPPEYAPPPQERQAPAVNPVGYPYDQ